MLKYNILANYSSKLWIIGIGIITIPIHMKLLGSESYGFAGLFFSFSVITTLFDFGVSHVIIREIAKQKAIVLTKEGKINLLSLIITLKYIVLLLSLILLIVPYLQSEWIVTSALTLDTISNEKAKQVIPLLGIASAITWFTSFHRNVLIGLQKQVWLSASDAIAFAFKHIGVILALIIKRDIEIFFLFIIFVSTIENITLQFKVNSLLKKEFGSGGKISISSLKSVWRYALSTASTSVLGVFISQTDIIVLPLVLPLKIYGFYIAARTLGRSIIQVAQPLTVALRPKLMELASQKEEEEAIRMYHTGAQYLALTIIPISIFISVFSEDILFIWTQNQELTNSVHVVLSWLVLGTMLNALMNLAYSLQLAYGWASLALHMNIVLALFLLPLTIFAINYLGVLGVGVLWFSANLFYMLVTIPLMHAKILKSEMYNWYVKDIFPPIFISIIIFSFFKEINSVALDLKNMLAVGVVNFVLCALVLTEPRTLILRNIRRCQNQN